MLIGWFIYNATQSSYQQSTLQKNLSGIKVKDIMVKDIVSLNPQISIDEAVLIFSGTATADSPLLRARNFTVS